MNKTETSFLKAEEFQRFKWLQVSMTTFFIQKRREALNSYMSRQRKKPRENSRELSDLNVSHKNDPVITDLYTNLHKSTD